MSSTPRVSPSAVSQQLPPIFFAASARLPSFPISTAEIIINADKAVLTGNKLTQKFYRRHTGYIGHLKETDYGTLMAQRPELAMELAVKGMVPDNTIGRSALTRLRVYKGADHKHAAQKPEAYTL